MRADTNYFSHRKAMTMATAPADKNYFTDALKMRLQHDINLISEEEVVDAQQSIKQRISEKLGGIALSVLDEFDVESNGNRLIITVRKIGA